MTISSAEVARSGPLLFARYAYPPNELGYCGPEEHRTLLEYAASGVTDPGLTQLARGFSGPWPYLTLIAGAAGIEDPFDHRVVEAYWVGNRLLDQVATLDFGNTIRDSFAPLVGSRWAQLAEQIPVGALAHHSFHVFGVYPWVGLLGAGLGDEPLTVLDRCRIRWGQVVEVHGDQAVVRSRRLTWDGRQLGLGPPDVEQVTHALDHLSYVGGLAAGEWVSMHWGWVCDRLGPRQLSDLRHYTRHQLAITNQVAHPGPAEAIS